jgi:hypothetical protein
MRKNEDLGVPEGVELVDVDGGRRRAMFRIESPLDPGTFLLVEVLSNGTKKGGSDPYDVKIPAEGDA